MPGQRGAGGRRCVRGAGYAVQEGGGKDRLQYGERLDGDLRGARGLFEPGGVRGGRAGKGASGVRNGRRVRSAKGGAWGGRSGRNAEK